MTAFVEGQRPSIPADGRDNRPPTAVVASDERLEQLLNRAGQTICDLPKPDDYCYAYDVNPETRHLVENTVREFCRFDVNYAIWIRAYQDYILHLTDVIDRMEWALENVCGERDWLREMNRLHAGCQTCAHHVDGDPLQCEDGKRLCKLGEDGACVSWEYCGVPEDWRADNENPVDA